MAKKKQETKSLEELLNEALVPEEEWPYEVPENWAWIHLKSIVDVKGGKRLPQGHSLVDEDTGYPYIRVADFENGTVNLESIRYVEEDTAKTISNYTITEKDIYISIAGTIGSVGIIPEQLNGANLTENAAKITNIVASYNKYLYYLLSSPMSQSNMVDSTVSTSQPKLALFRIGNLLIPLPPLAEQKRIVDKLEFLLGKINEAKELIEEAKETFEKRRAAILAKAFKGELTAKWREENPKVEPAIGLRNHLNINIEDIPYDLPNGWQWARLIDLCDFKSGYAFKSSDFVDEGIQIIRMGNLFGGELSLERSPVFLPRNYDPKIVEKYSVKQRDILLTLTGTKYKRDYGNAVKITNFDNILLLNQRILSITPKLLSDYVYYYLQSETFRDIFFSYETGGVNQGNVSSKAVENILIPMPPLSEGRFIGELVDKLLKSGKQIRELLSLAENVDLIEKSVLSKAFRGQLGTNNPEEESAIELLKQVLQEKLN